MQSRQAQRLTEAAAAAAHTCSPPLCLLLPACSEYKVDPDDDASAAFIAKCQWRTRQQSEECDQMWDRVDSD